MIVLSDYCVQTDNRIITPIFQQLGSFHGIAPNSHELIPFTAILGLTNKTAE
ncbi:MAG: hypothetical protein ACTSYI_00510 [Promethearchaeota archaeon]